VTTAALAACALAAGLRVAVVKPVQTGLRPGEPGDVDEVHRLTGLADRHELVRYAHPLAPATAARLIGEPGPSIADLTDRVCALADRDLLLVEGAGGALVRFNARGDTLLDLTIMIARGLGTAGVEIVLTASSGLGTLHTAAATARAVEQHGLRPAHLVITDWPVSGANLAQRCNVTDLPDYAGAPLHGVIDAGAGGLDPRAFAALAMRSLTPVLGGTADPEEFRRRAVAAG
jgi:dethiobiotin synthetase